MDAHVFPARTGGHPRGEPVPEGPGVRLTATVLRAGVEAAMAEGFRLPVTGGCMTPAVPEGARVRVEPCAPGGLAPGDVVLFQNVGQSVGQNAGQSAGQSGGPSGGRGGAFRLHRYIGSLRAPRAAGGGRLILTKADGALRPDAAWPAAGLVGRLVEVRTRDETLPYRPRLLDRLRAAAFGLAWVAALTFLGKAGLRRGRRTGGATADGRR